MQLKRPEEKRQVAQMGADKNGSNEPRMERRRILYTRGVERIIKQNASLIGWEP
jgi:hypothetical protein